MNLTDPPSSAIVLEGTIEPAFLHYSNRLSLISKMEIDSAESSPVPSSSPESSVGSSRGTTPDIPDAQDHCCITQDEGMRNERSTVKNICCIGAGYVGEFKFFRPQQILMPPGKSRVYRPLTTNISGGPTAAVIALQNPNIHISVADKDPLRIKKWNSQHLPVHEPGLDHIVRIARDGTRETSLTINEFGQTIHIPARSSNLSFSTDIDGCIAAADIIFVSVNTPTKTSGIGAGSATNLAAFEGAIISIAKSIRPGAIIVEKSTVPCGTAQTIQDIVSLSNRRCCWYGADL